MPTEKRARQRALRDQKLAIQERHDRRSRRTRRSITLVIVVGVIIALVALLSGGGTKKPTASKSTTTTSVSTTTTEPVAKTAIAPVCPPATAAGAAKRVISFTKVPPMCIATNSVFDATVITDVGTFVIKLTTATSPVAVNNFVFLARYHFYNGITFHRAMPNFMIQGGDPTGTGQGGAGYHFTGNTPPSSCVAKSDCYATGDVALANSGAPSSDGSQFFVIVPGGASQLSDLYTVIGQVTSGMSVVEKIAADGDSADNGQPPKVTHHMISVTVQQINA
jgi:cyclophilin family peptidyl-prolyl cis-trans isomerase